MRGVCLCRVLPPSNEKFPCIPYRNKRNKVSYTLCSACADLGTKKSCSHSDFQRSFVATLTVPEILYAHKAGYLFNDFFEAWLYFNSTPFLRKIMRVLAAYKLKHSGLPSHLSLDEKQNLIRQLNEKMQWCVCRHPLRLRSKRMSCTNSAANVLNSTGQMVSAIF